MLLLQQQAALAGAAAAPPPRLPQRQLLPAPPPRLPQRQLLPAPPPPPRRLRLRAFSDAPSAERGFLPSEDPPASVREALGAAAAGALSAADGDALDAWDQAAALLPKLALASDGVLRRRLEELPPFPLSALSVVVRGAPGGAASAGASAGGAHGASAGGAHGASAGGAHGAAAGGAHGAAAWRAYTVLSFLAHAHIWLGGPTPPAELPARLAVPWAAVAAALDMPPVLVYSTYNLINWRRLDPAGPVALGNIVCLQARARGLGLPLPSRCAACRTARLTPPPPRRPSAACVTQ